MYLAKIELFLNCKKYLHEKTIQGVYINFCELGGANR